MEREYIREWDFLHSHVDDIPLLPTDFPKAQRQVYHGVEALFHSFHSLYCYC